MPRYWASYGRSGFLGSFAAQDRFARGTAVVLNSPRGVESATILEEVIDHFAPSPQSEGTILRVLSDADTILADRMAHRSAHFLHDATLSAAALPVLVADAELLFDERTLILHVMLWDRVDLTSWVIELSQRFALEVRLLNLAEFTPEKLPGCGEPNCGQANGGCTNCGSGCSTGNCSKGSVKSAEELTAYFANLRKLMETQRRSLI